MKPNRIHPKARRRRAMAREREIARTATACSWSDATDPVAVEVERHTPLQPWSQHEAPL